MRFLTASVCLIRGGAIGGSGASPDGLEFLQVRKRDTAVFIFPGGKLEPGESMQECALRELQEETAIVLQPSQVRELGHFEAAAANEPGAVVASTVFVASGDGLVPQPCAEIAECRWWPVADPSGCAELSKLVASVLLGDS